MQTFKVSRENALGTAATLGYCILFGFSYVVTRSAVTEVSTATLLSWRFGVAFIVFLVLRLCRVIKIDLCGKRIGRLLALGLAQPVLYYVLEAFGVKYTSASEAGMLVAAAPIVAMILAAVFLRQKPTKLQIVAIPATVAGVAMIVFGSGYQAGGSQPVGYVFLILSMFAGNSFLVLSALAEGFTAIEKTYVMMAMGAAVYGAWGLIEHLAAGTATQWLALPFSNPAFGGAVLYLGVGCSCVAFALENFAVGTIGVTRAASFGGLITLVTVVCGVTILREPFSWLQAAGGAVVLLGVYGANRAPRAKNATIETEKTLITKE